MKIIPKSVLLIIAMHCAGSALAQSAASHRAMPMPPMPMPPASNSAPIFSTDTTGLPAVLPTSEVILKDGDNFTLDASPAKQNVAGQWIRRLAYNGSVPGPIFRVKQGSSVHLTLKNDTEIETTLHSHGLRLDSHFDGVPGVGQKPIAPGESFTYDLTFPDAGIYWYHPHIREDYTQNAGLYGIFLVEPSDATTYNVVHKEVPLVLNDILIDMKQPFQKNVVTHTLMGRFGNVDLVNGMVLPTFNITVGEVIRFFVLNSSNARPYAFSIPGSQLKVVGGDNGLTEKEEWATKVILGPGERAIVEVSFAKAGAFSIVNAKPTNPTKLAKIVVSAGQVAALPIPFKILRQSTVATAEIAKVRRLFQKPVDKKLTLTLAMDMAGDSMGGMDMGNGSMDGMDMSGGSMGGMDMGSMNPAPSNNPGIEWEDDMGAMNSASTNKSVTWKMVDDSTAKENTDIQWSFKKGDYIKIRFFNDPKSMHPMQHPIHFHGQRFVVSSMDGKTPENLGWKDTVLIPSGSTYEIILEASNPGSWMSHCHISEHLEANMMLNFNVTE